MTTPFRALAPLTPRFVEIEYFALAGECCVSTTTDTSTTSGDDSDVI
jgi:hypothetical protein